jgi:hypothetical protein
VGAPAKGDTFLKFKIDLLAKQKILSDIEAIVWKLSL